MTLQQFAVAAYTSTATASRWETSKRRPHNDQLPHIAVVLRVDVPWLLAAFDNTPRRAADTCPCPGLRTLREAAGLARRTFADQLSVSVATVAHWECARRRLPRARLAAVASALSLPLTGLEQALSRPSVDPSVTQLRELRLRAGVTQLNAARALGVTASTISGYERGLRQVPYRNVRQLAVVYEQSIPVVEEAAGQTPIPHPATLDYERRAPAAVLQTVMAWGSVTRADLGRRSGIHLLENVPALLS